MSELSPTRTEPRTLAATMRLGPVHLVVNDLGRSIAWYERALGLTAGRRQPDQAELGDSTQTVVVLHEDRDARPAGRDAGLYHYALLYPSREELAQAALRVGMAQTPIQGASDHGTHEAIYLPDPDGNGIELAADRPPELWPDPAEEFSRGGPQPLDFDSLLSVLPDRTVPAKVGPGLRVGHLHLHVGDVEEGLRFYRDALGFELRASLGSAAFVSVGGYHHHLAFNVWRGQGVRPAPPHTTGLHHWTMLLGSEQEVAAVRDRLQAAGIATEELPEGFRVRDPWQIPLAVEHR